MVERLVDLALEEDIRDGDITSEFFVPATDRCVGSIEAREPGIVSGVDVSIAVFNKVDPDLEIEIVIPEGEEFATGDTIMKVTGSTRSVLTAERTVLNFMQRLSGIATMTAVYVEAVQPHNPAVLDTRKTTPGWRHLEKAAVLAGGGTNHRMGLYDQVMVKDNHLLAEGNLEALQGAIDAAKAAHPNAKIQLEADTMDQVSDFLDLRDIDYILLDNMDLDDMRRCVVLNDGKVDLEASGGITLQTIAQVAATGVQRISSGALTHSVRALDLGMKINPLEDTAS